MNDLNNPDVNPLVFRGEWKFLDYIYQNGKSLLFNSSLVTDHNDSRRWYNWRKANEISIECVLSRKLFIFRKFTPCAYIRLSVLKSLFLFIVKPSTSTTNTASSSNFIFFLFALFNYIYKLTERKMHKEIAWKISYT